MDVLEHPVGVVRHLDAEVLVHARVPLLREVGERDPAREQLLLELEAEDHVEVVRDLVRLDADERGLHLVHRPVEALGVGRPEHLGERVPQHGEEPAPERPAAADEVLPEPALRLVETEGDAATERRSVELGRRAVLVEAVAELVDPGEHAHEGVLDVPRGDPDVREARARRERVDRGVEPPRRLVEAERRQDGDHSRPLPLDGERALRERAVDGVRRVAHRRDERHELLLEPVEHLPHLGRRHIGLEVVQQHVVGLPCRLEALHVAVLELQVALERGDEAGEVRLGASLEPGLMAERRRSRDLGRKGRRHAARLLVVTARDADQARLERVVREALLVPRKLLEQPADLVVDQGLVENAAERSHLLGASRSATRRHHYLLIPAEHPPDAPEIREPGEPLLQVGKGLLGGRSAHG